MGDKVHERATFAAALGTGMGQRSKRDLLPAGGYRRLGLSAGREGRRIVRYCYSRREAHWLPAQLQPLCLVAFRNQLQFGW